MDLTSIEAIGKAYKKNKVVLLSVKEKQGSAKTLETPSVSEIRVKPQSPRDGAQNGKTSRSEKKTEKEKEKGTKKDKKDKREKGKSAKKQDTAETERAEKERERQLELEREYEQERIRKESQRVPPSPQPAATVPPLELDSIFLGVMTPTIASKSLVRTCLFPPPANSKYC